MSERDYALVSGGNILAVRRAEVPPQDGDFSDEFPGDSKWLPIVDAETRDLGVAPRYEVSGHLVRRAYR